MADSVLVPACAQLRLFVLLCDVSLLWLLISQHGTVMESPSLGVSDSHMDVARGLGLVAASAVMEEQLDSVSEGFSNPNNSVIPW